MAVAPVIALLCAAGTSQAQTPPSEVINNQIQLGDVFSTQTLNVVSVTEGVGAETSSTGNNLVGSTDGADLNITSNQTMAGYSSKRRRRYWIAIAQPTANGT